MKKIFALIMILSLLTACAADNSRKAPDYDNLSLEEKVGQLFFVRCDESHMDNILSKNPGGILMFGADFQNLDKQQVIDKIQSYQDKSAVPLIIGVDEEGGSVTRVSANPKLSDEDYFSPQKYYQLGGMDAIIENTAVKSRLLTSLGINMNLAPVADVSTNPEDFIYKRSFGMDAAATSDYVANVITAMRENHIGSCLKHFPGYGSNTDTHTDIAIDNRPMSEFENSDFLPFIAGIEAGADAVLVSHNIVNCIDEEYPASISPKAHDILRNTLNFDKIIITDDMAMDAMENYDDVYIKAVNAGNNLIIVTDFDKAYNEVLEGVKSGKISEETIDQASQVTLEWKKNNL